MRKLLLAALALVLFVGQVLAQKTISGRVTDESGAPLPNVSVTVEGFATGTTTKKRRNLFTECSGKCHQSGVFFHRQSH